MAKVVEQVGGLREGMHDCQPERSDGPLGPQEVPPFGFVQGRRCARDDRRRVAALCAPGARRGSHQAGPTLSTFRH